ncbi:MAG: hypothetical protein HY880_06070, partial [Deltaproteobacteria bacterium]|nr:hypothetical protein [Deltaproteobacteria bacterium]
PGSKLSDHLNKISQPDGPKKAPLSFLNGFTRYAYATCGSCGVTEGGQEEGAPRGPKDTKGIAAFTGLLNRAMAEKDKYVTVCDFDISEEPGKWTLRLDLTDDRGKREFIENKFDVVSKGEGEAAQGETRESNRIVTRSDGDVIELWEGGYIQIIRRWDGTIIVRLGQTQIEKRRDGSEVVIWPNGTTTTRQRGETELTPGHHVIIQDDGTVIERWDDPHATIPEIERRADGTKVIRDRNGHTEWRYSDGRVTERWSDNREITRWPGGIEVETLPDTTEITRRPDHTEIEIRPDNTVIERRPLDGVEIESRPRDRIVIVRFAFGPIAEIESHPDLTEITRYRDGTEIVRGSDGSIIRSTRHEEGPGVGRSEFPRFEGWKSRIKPQRKPDVAKSRRASKRLSEKSRKPFHGCDEWGRPQVWIDKDGDGLYDTVRTYDYDGRPTSEIQWEGVSDHQNRIRIYNRDGGYTEYVDTDSDGIMDKKITVDAQGNRTEEPSRTIISYDPNYQNYDVWSDIDENGVAHTQESYDKDGHLRERTTWDERGNPTTETWDASGNPVSPGSWIAARDWAEHSREEFRRGTGIDGSPSPWASGGGADYEWTEGDDGVPRPRGLVRP